MRSASLMLSLLVIIWSNSTTAADPSPKLNVLFIYSDDLRPELGCYGHPTVKTPNIDALANAGVKFERAYCQFPLCNPSRTSTLTGRYPHTTGVLGNRSWFGADHPEIVSLPKFFKQNGYVTLRSGKIFHGGIDDFEAWTEGGDRRTTPGVNRGPSNGTTATSPATVEALDSLPGQSADAAPRRGRREGPPRGNPQRRSDSIIVIPGDGDDIGDGAVAGRAINFLREHQNDRFFLGVGFVKPHSPPEAPQRFFDLYDPATATLPPDFAPRPTAPPGIPAISVRQNTDLFIGRDASESEAKEFIRAYWASLTWMDHNVGRVVSELDQLGLREKTVIVFLGDHGYHLGEKGRWSKAGSLFEVGARIPLIIVAPNAQGNGTASPRIVESVDLYRTLADLAGLKAPEGVEGRSLVPLLNDPQAEWNHPAFTVWSEANREGFSVRTEKYRYAEWESVDGGAADAGTFRANSSTLKDSFLFDEDQDPDELTNLANDPAFAQIRQELSELLNTYREAHSKQ